jgi:hypothetical protein
VFTAATTRAGNVARLTWSHASGRSARETLSTLQPPSTPWFSKLDAIEDVAHNRVLANA